MTNKTIRVLLVNYSLTLIFFAICLHGHAQQKAEVEWSKRMRIDRSERYMEIVGSDSSSFYVFKDVKGSEAIFKLEQYNKSSLQLEREKEVNIPKVNGQQTFLEELIFINDRFYLFTSQVGESDAVKMAYGTEISKDGEAIGETVRLDLFELGRKRNQIDVDVKLSSDSSSFLVYHNRPFSKQSDEIFSFRIFDFDFNLLYQKELSLPYKHQAYEISDYLFDGSSNIYMLSGMTPQKSESRVTRIGPENKRYVLLNYDFESNTLKEYDVSVKNKWINSVTFGVTPKGDLAIGGFYSNDFRFSISGTFYFLLDGASKAVKAQGLMPFSSDFLRKFGNSRDRDNQRLEDYFFDHFLLFENGEAILIAEQYYVSEMIRTDPATGYQTINYVYNYNDIIIVKINANGSIAWNVKVPKYQATTNDNGPYSSYALVWDHRKIHLLFNDHQDNFERLRNDPNAGLKSFGNVRRSVAALVTVNEDGKMKRQKLFDAKEVDTVLKPKIAFQSESNEIIIYGKKRRNFKFGRVQFEN